MESSCRQTARILKALSDPKRLRIVNMLTDQEMSASQILDVFNVSQPTLSHDMHVLLDTGLLLERRVGKCVFYRLDQQAVQTFREELGQLLEGAGPQV